ncbi:MAG: type VI secretion system tip protein VgrG [Acidobacteria bacterium]|nr:type VI secretion system tip protein VgrG [Acidobacteriota bacterium]
MAASFLKIAGELFRDAILSLVEVTQELNRHTWCVVECRKTRDLRFPAEDCLGKDLQIVTYDQDQVEHVLFDGFVLRARLRYEVFGSYTAVLTAVSRSYKFDLSPREAYFRKQQLPAIADALAGADGLKAQVECKTRPAKNYVQWGETGFQFLLRLADDHGAWLRPTAQGIQIRDEFQPGAKLQWRDADGLLGFNVRGELAQPAFNGTHYDARTMQSKGFTKAAKDTEFFGASGPMVAAVKRESKSRLPPGHVHLDSRAATPGEYQELLERESVRSIGGHIVARGSSRTEALLPGDKVEIEGVLDAAGTYGLTKVVHRWTKDGYQNDFWCTPSKRYLSLAAPQPREMPGVVPARVVDHHDPRKMGRLKVQYDWQEGGETAWARMVTPHAGAGRGFLFLPEKGDEVLVAFEHGDAERPYILGSLWNGVDQAPRQEFWGEDVDPNDVKRIVTKSGHRIQFSDKDGKESIVVATPNHLKIALLEKAGETGRSMILLHSANGDMFFSAPDGRIHFRSRDFSREVGAAGGAARADARTGPKKTAPAAHHAAQIVALRTASATGRPLCEP